MNTSQMQEALKAALDAHDAAVRRHRDRVEQGLLTEAGHADAVANDRAANGWTAKIDSVLSELDEREAAADALLKREEAAILEPAPGTATEQLLAETRAVRAWERLKSTMDGREPVAAHMMALDAIRSTTGDERRVIVEELPAYLISRALPGSHQTNIQSIQEALAASVPSYAAAVAYQREMASVVSHIRSTAQTTRRIVESDQLGGYRGEIVVRNGEFADFPTPPARPDTRTPEKRAADARAFEEAFKNLRNGR